MTKETPNYLERVAMAAIQGDPNYQATPRMLAKLTRKGWIEKRDLGEGPETYQLTAAGRDAIKAKVRIYD